MTAKCETDTMDNWMIDNDRDGLRIVFTGTKRKAKDLFNHLKAMYPTTKLYCNGKLIK